MSGEFQIRCKFKGLKLGQKIAGAKVNFGDMSYEDFVAVEGVMKEAFEKLHAMGVAEAEKKQSKSKR